MALQLPVDGRRQQQLFDRFVCPRCRGAVQLVNASSSHDVVVNGQLDCSRCGIVGVIRNGTTSFLEHDLTTVELDSVSVELDDALDERNLTGQWQRVPEGVLGLTIGARAAGSFDGTGIEYEVLGHSWSGVARFRLGDQVREVDLHSADPARQTIASHGLPAGRHDWSVQVVSASPAASHATQLVLCSVRAITRADQVVPTRPLPVNRGNPYPDTLNVLLADVPADAFVLDLGGGDRRHPDPRVFNLEYLPYHAVDMYADGLTLPLADGCVDAILSQAVLEHVPDPKQAVAEMMRILRPGGQLYAEFAFIQPLHAVPYHFFNITTHGAALLFEGFDDVRISTFGGLHVTLEWMFSLLDAENRLGAERVSQVLAALAALDSTLSERELEHVASAVTVLARAPHREK